MRRLFPLVSCAAAALISSSLVVLPTAQAVGLPQPTDCPTAMPVAEVTDGLVATGWTVAKGTTKESFSATVLGTLEDGIAPGVDMIMAELDSPSVVKAGGVWAGMSGSPVYAADGRLIGSVSYGLAPSSPVAGITPAADLLSLTTNDPDDPQAARVVPDAVSMRRLTRTGAASTRQAQQGFRQLAVPLMVSGVRTRSTDKLAARVQRKTGQRVVTSGAASQTGVSPTVSISAGSNFASVIAYGDATLSGVGTTTLVCAGKAVAFGHPMLDAGVTTMSAHSASAVLIQKDPVAGPFKLANIGPVKGVVDRDRALGLRARLGAGPRGTAITSTLTRVENGSKRTGRTTAVYEPLLGDAAAYHAIYNVDRVMGSSASKGTARLDLTLSGKRAKNKPFTVHLGEVFTSFGRSDEAPLDFQVASWVFDNVSALIGQPYEDVTLDSVNLTGTVSSAVSTWREPVIRIAQKGKWVTGTKGVSMHAGKNLPIHVRVSKYRDASTRKVIRLSMPAPKAARGHLMDLSIVGSAGSEFEQFLQDVEASDGEFPASSQAPATFNSLLADMQSTPRSDQVTFTFTDEETGRLYSTRTVRLSMPVDPFSFATRVLAR